MKRRVLGIIAALILAAVGTAALVAYVESAKDEAVAGEEPVPVYIVRDEVRQGATLDEIRSSVELEDVPARLKAPDAIADLTVLSGNLVAAVDLRPGEQLLTSRLVDERSLIRVDVPAGLLEITLELEPQRAVGGELQPGSTVGMIMSFEPFEISASGQPTSPDDTSSTETTTAPNRTPNTTHFTLHKILVTAVQYSRADTERASEVSGTESEEATDSTIAATIDEAPGDSLLITLAVSAPEAEQIVFAAEFGRVWLTAEGPDADEDGTRIVTLGQVYVSVPR